MNIQQASLWSKALILEVQLIPYLATTMILSPSLPSFFPPPFFFHNEYEIYYTAGLDSYISARLLFLKGKM